MRIEAMSTHLLLEVLENEFKREGKAEILTRARRAQEDLASQKRGIDYIVEALEYNASTPFFLAPFALMMAFLISFVF